MQAGKASTPATAGRSPARRGTRTSGGSNTACGSDRSSKPRTERSESVDGRGVRVRVGVRVGSTSVEVLLLLLLLLVLLLLFHRPTGCYSVRRLQALLARHGLEGHVRQ